MTFVDTNYFLRFLLKDKKEQYLVAYNLFQDGILGQVKLFASIIVFFEINWVLSSIYDMKKTTCLPILEKVLKMNYIQIEWRPLIEKAIIIYKNTTLDLEDSFNLIYSKSHYSSDFATFDAKLKKEFERSKKS